MSGCKIKATTFFLILSGNFRYYIIYPRYTTSRRGMSIPHFFFCHLKAHITQLLHYNTSSFFLHHVCLTHGLHVHISSLKPIPSKVYLSICRFTQGKVMLQLAKWIDAFTRKNLFPDQKYLRSG